MKRIILISDQRDNLPCFDAVERSRNFDFELRRVADLKKLLTGGYQFIYLDIGGMKDREIKRTVRMFEAQEEISYGIVDPNGVIPDPADLFHGGASDYLGPAMISQKIAASRYLQAADFYPVDEEELPAGGDLSWADIREGGEYPFFFLYVELDVHPEWKSKSGKGLISGVLKTFETHISRVFVPLGGQIWMRNEYGVLILFPFSEGESDVIPVCMRMVLNRVLISTEIYSYGQLLPYHFAFDKGTTLYRNRDETGTLISDSVNFIFHLGQRHTPEGHFVISERVAEHIPEGLGDCFIPHGSYHGQQLLRMRMQK